MLEQDEVTFGEMDEELVMAEEEERTHFATELLPGHNLPRKQEQQQLLMEKSWLPFAMGNPEKVEEESMHLDLIVHGMSCLLHLKVLK